MKEIPFINKYVNPILAGEKWLTVRYDWEEYPDEGEEVWLIDSTKDEKIVRAIVQWKTKITIKEFVDKEWAGHENYVDAEHMTRALKHFYPNADFDADTEVTLLGFQTSDGAIRDKYHNNANRPA